MNDNSIKTSIELIDKLLIDNNYEVKIDPPINLDINLNKIKITKNKIDVFLFDTFLKKTLLINSKFVKNISFKPEKFKDILSLNITNILKFKKLGNIYLFSNYLQEYSKDKRLVNIQYEINEEQFMYERVRCMYDFVHSKLFINPTCFLDTDAFVNLEKIDFFKKNFDVGLTFREDEGYMPINEGVIFVNNNKKNKIKKFFCDYLKNFELIRKSPIVNSFYEVNPVLWRGGQLSLNMVAYNHSSKFRNFEIIKRKNYDLLMLPTFYYNFTPIISFSIY